MQKPYFSVVIPCLNEEGYLPLLLNNLTSQLFKDFEVIVVDGNSDDKTKEVALSFALNLDLTVVTSEKRSASYQRNLGARHARAKIIVFFDADTQIPKNYLSKIFQAFETKNPDMLTTWIKVKSKKEKGKAIEIGSNLIFELALFFGTAAVYGSMLAVKKSVFTKVGGFRVRMKFREDTELAQRVVKKGYLFVILRNTRYIFSTRRFKGNGFWKKIQQAAILNIASAFNLKRLLASLDYPMGGHVFQKIPRSKYSKLGSSKFFKNLLADLGLD